jgi:hypothetical protein
MGGLTTPGLVECPQGSDCRKKRCRKIHPDNRPSPGDTEWYNSYCNFGNGCTRRQCRFLHYGRPQLLENECSKRGGDRPWKQNGGDNSPPTWRGVVEAAADHHPPTETARYAVGAGLSAEQAGVTVHPNGVDPPPPQQVQPLMGNAPSQGYPPAVGEGSYPGPAMWAPQQVVQPLGYAPSQGYPPAVGEGSYPGPAMWAPQQVQPLMGNAPTQGYPPAQGAAGSYPGVFPMMWAPQQQHPFGVFQHTPGFTQAVGGGAIPMCWAPQQQPLGLPLPAQGSPPAVDEDGGSLTDDDTLSAEEEGKYEERRPCHPQRGYGPATAEQQSAPPQSTGGKRNTPPRCNYGGRCYNIECGFTHPETRKDPRTLLCKFGPKCNRKDECWFVHEDLPRQVVKPAGPPRRPFQANRTQEAPPSEARSKPGSRCPRKNKGGNGFHAENKPLGDGCSSNSGSSGYMSYGGFVASRR